ncbi:DNA polymerase III subunit gamma and tau [Sanguibacter antarcticus]|uniref:DNA polymerase III subunit gamma/tau n=1 Tax=Sanguibacter antarcticus TaxID=372484 RepID=A0A2A9E691_9MICO|nr:DNA polymerase III subunit gamma and tau [Sanguibacter antarcticus]PFG34354.1 DNA polymerase-3 subunit gamma/tau [Sanguibacter antarcticus]
MSTALYRRYRPENFAEVIGQEHVTGPLMQALRSDRVNHAYLFSGPRGCGKTTSARILARILNCARNTPQSPTDTPCGECESCIDLARGGPGSLDVVEIDAASHGGVDDARELRERATFSPSRDRFKIFILDEAHMVTAQGFNALLKIVEEPPEYLKFIFATTEPDKVIGTIRSRTHHYPFRLVAPETLQAYLGDLCASEGISVGSGVLPLVVRAGGGSVRDSLSVLDQLMAGAQDATLDYERAVSLLGYTHVTLLDDVVEALAARDGAVMFRVVDHVVSTGHEPRRFVEDLLERLRDLIVLSVSGDAAQAVLRSVPADQMARMMTQATNLGATELSRSADVVNAALSEMSGATSPRLHLELLCARLLLPAVDDSLSGVGARLDRLERGVVHAPVQQAVAPAVRAQAEPVPAAPAPPAAGPVERAPVPAAPAAAAAPAAPAAPRQDEEVPAAHPMREPAEHAPVAPAAGRAADARVESSPSVPAPSAAPAPAPTQAQAQAAAAGMGSAASTEMLRRRWPEVLDTLSRLRKATWALVSQNAQVADLTDTTLYLTFASAGLATAFRSSPGAELVQRAVRETLGFDVRVEGGLEEQVRGAGGPSGRGASSGGATAAPGAGPESAPGAGSGSPVGRIAGVDPAAAAASWDAPARPASGAAPAPVAGPSSAAQPPQTSAPQGPGAVVRPGATHPGEVGSGPSHAGRARPSAGGPSEFGEEPPDDFDPGHEPPPEPERESPRQAAERRVARSRREEMARTQVVDDPQPDDEDLASSGLVGAPLVVQMLGGVVVDDIINSGS